MRGLLLLNKRADVCPSAGYVWREGGLHLLERWRWGHEGSYIDYGVWLQAATTEIWTLTLGV